MPCTCDGYPEPPRDDHNGPAADALCKVLQEHEARGEMGCFDAKTLAWWEEHKARDRARLQQDMSRAHDEAQRAAAIAKLTPFEIALLGIKP